MINKLSKIILAIETSCDETAAAIIEYTPNTLSLKGEGLRVRGLSQIKTLSSVIKSQIKLHSKMGGVVPEAAARAQVKNILPVVQKALIDASRTLFDGRQKVSFSAILHFSAILNKIDYLAVTIGPGLIPSLIVGVEFAKGLSFATGKSIIPVNHLEGHLYSPLNKIKDKGLRIKDSFPMISLIVSGGHTILTLMKNEKQYRVLGQTLDDAAGEAFDKIAKLLKLPYPGGPEIAKLARRGRAIIDFPRPMIHHKNYNFSFAGLKTAVLYFVKDKGLKIKDIGLKADICASFQQAVVDVLVAKALRAAKEFKAKSISLSGGVSANWLLRRSMQNECKKNQLLFFAPPAHLCTDNAEMIGIAAAFKLHNGFKPTSYKKVKPDSNLEL